MATMTTRGVMAVLVALAACAGPRAMSPRPTAVEISRAIELGEQAVAGSGAAPTDYRVIRAINLMAPDGKYRGPTYWQLTFKLRTLVPSTAGAEVGKGGEIFVNVDLAAGTALVTGHGE